MGAEHSLSPGPLHGCLRGGGQSSSGLTCGQGSWCRTAGTRYAGRQSLVRVHMKVQAEEGAVCQVLQSRQAANRLPHSAVLASEAVAFLCVQQILLTLAFRAASPDHTCSLHIWVASDSSCSDVHCTDKACRASCCKASIPAGECII